MFSTGCSVHLLQREVRTLYLYFKRIWRHSPRFISWTEGESEIKGGQHIDGPQEAKAEATDVDRDAQTMMMMFMVTSMMMSMMDE